jgi:hypothetical protein
MMQVPGVIRAHSIGPFPALILHNTVSIIVMSWVGWSGETLRDAYCM